MNDTIVAALIIDRNRPEETKRCEDSCLSAGVSAVYTWNNNARNLGVAEPTNHLLRGPYKYWLLVDNDALVPKGFVELALEFMEWNLEVAVVGGRVVDPSGKPMYDEMLGIKYCPWFYQNCGMFAATCCLVRTEAFLNVGGYNEDYFAYYLENDLAAKLIKKGWEVWYAPIKIVHERTENQRDNVQVLDLLIRNHFLFLIEHLPWEYCVIQGSKWVVWSIVKGWNHPVTVCRSYLKLLRLLPKYLKRRNPTRNELILNCWKKVIR